ncbi:MAG: hypothetical protein FWG77_02835 [Treponema sp.]|nr:hypothetical protein [Treponema sp.]
MVPAGLLSSIFSGAARIDRGRKGLSTNGQEHEGRISYEEGVAGASKAFSQALSTLDPLIIMIAEEAFLEQELRFCSESDTHTISSLTQALQSFSDAFRCLETVEDPVKYKAAETTWPNSRKYRVQGFPKDALHLACLAHRTRLYNTLRSPGINMIEKALLTQRASNMTIVQNIYTEKQRKSLQEIGVN